MQLLPINKAAACSHVYSVFFRILCPSLAYTDSFSIASEEQDSSFGLSLLVLSTFYASTPSVFATVVNIKQCRNARLSGRDGKMLFSTIGLTSL